MLKQHDSYVNLGKIGGLDTLAARDMVNLPKEADVFVESQLKKDN